MPVQFKLPASSTLVDKQFFQVPQSDGLLAGFQYDVETNTLYQKESQIIIPSLHGLTHVAEDLVPNATCDSPGLQSADDKCKLDSLLQTRVGVLGYQGAGFPDDGGFIVGDIILAAGTEFISLERVGNTVRFTVDSPIPLDCACETCSQIFWIQDSSEPRAIRPPSCNGVLPDLTSYGELKIYTFPETTILDPNDPNKTLNQKGNYPALIFKRYDNALTPFENSFELVLKRNSNATTHTGWAFTPPVTAPAQCVWFMGTDKQGGQIKFEFWPDMEPGLLGSLLYKGHLITKKMAVVTDYDAAILNNNQYVLRLWDIEKAEPVGDSFTATNIWQYTNPENSATATSNPKTLKLDATIDVLPVGSLVDIWEFEISRTSEQRLTRSYFSKQPPVNPAALWALSAAVQFGDLFTAREEIDDPGSVTAVDASEINIPDKRQFEKTIWGINNFEDRLILADDGGEVESCDNQIIREPSGEPINNDVVADIDPAVPGLRVLKQTTTLVGDINDDGVVDDEDLRLFMCAYNTTIFDAAYNPRADFNQDGRVDIRDLAVLGQQFDLNVEKVSDRPIFLWHRGNHRNTLTRARIAMPSDGTLKYPPYDLLLSAPVDSFAETPLKILRRGVIVTGPFAGAPYVVAKGTRWEDLPSEGVLRILTGAFRNSIWNYYFKAAFSNWDDDALMLIGRSEVFPFDEDFPIGPSSTECTFAATATDATDVTSEEVTASTYCDVDAVEVPTNTTVVELLRQDYSSPAVRFQFTVNSTTGLESVQLQLRVGVLDMSVPYECNVAADPADDLVRGFQPGFTVSKVYVQNGFITDGVGTDITSTPSGFRVYEGGELEVPVGGQTEKWNDLEVMHRDNQIWVWWNGMLIPPDTVASANLTTPVAVNTPYFPINPQLDVGKVAMRMFPGAVIRSMEVRDQLAAFNEFTRPGQLELVS